MARRYDSKLDVSLIDAAQAAADSLDQASSMKEQQRKEKKLDSAFLALAGALAEAPLSAKDTEYVIGFVAEYQASQDRIERDPYHAYAASVQKETSGWFPSLLQKLTASPIDIYQIGG